MCQRRFRSACRHQQLVGEHFNAGAIDQLDQKLRKCDTIDEVIRVVSTHISSHFEGELKYSQLENERLESQVMMS